MRELGFGLFLILSLSSFVFVLIHLVPGDPVDFILKDGANLEEKQVLRKELGLDQNIFRQYTAFIKNLFQLNLGRSIHREEPVTALLWRNFPHTLQLALLSLFLSLLWGIPLGAISTARIFKPLEKVFNVFPVLIFSVPAFVSAPLLIWVFALHFPLLPVGGAEGFSHLILPAVSLALPLGAILMKVTRVSMLETLSAEYVKTATAKGLSPGKIYFRHILFNALIPIVTIAGLQLGSLLTGTVIIEIIFDRPGLGSLLFSAVTTRDYPLIQGTVLLMALIYIFANKLTDKIYGLIHPQMGGS